MMIWPKYSSSPSIFTRRSMASLIDSSRPLCTLTTYQRLLVSPAGSSGSLSSAVGGTGGAGGAAPAALAPDHSGDAGWESESCWDAEEDLYSAPAGGVSMVAS